MSFESPKTKHKNHFREYKRHKNIFNGFRWSFLLLFPFFFIDYRMLRCCCCSRVWVVQGRRWRTRRRQMNESSSEMEDARTPSHSQCISAESAALVKLIYRVYVNFGMDNWMIFHIFSADGYFAVLWGIFAFSFDFVSSPQKKSFSINCAFLGEIYAIMFASPPPKSWAQSEMFANFFFSSFFLCFLNQLEGNSQFFFALHFFRLYQHNFAPLSLADLGSGLGIYTIESCVVAASSLGNFE